MNFQMEFGELRKILTSFGAMTLVGCEESQNVLNGTYYKNTKTMKITKIKMKDSYLFKM